MLPILDCSPNLVFEDFQVWFTTIFGKINEILAKISLFPLELPNNLTHRILGNQKKSGKSQNFIDLWPSAQSSSRSEKQKLSFSCSALYHIRTRFCLKCFVIDCSLIWEVLNFGYINVLFFIGGPLNILFCHSWLFHIFKDTLKACFW